MGRAWVANTSDVQRRCERFLPRNIFFFFVIPPLVFICKYHIFPSPSETPTTILDMVLYFGDSRLPAPSFALHCHWLSHRFSTLIRRHIAIRGHWLPHHHAPTPGVIGVHLSVEFCASDDIRRSDVEVEDDVSATFGSTFSSGTCSGSKE